MLHFIDLIMVVGSLHIDLVDQYIQNLRKNFVLKRHLASSCHSYFSCLESILLKRHIGEAAPESSVFRKSA